MKCLHICNDFSLTKVHSKLYSQLDNLSLEQIIYNPVRLNTPVGNNSINFKLNESRVIYSKMLKKKHKLLFRKKISFLFNDLESQYNLKKIDFIHATTLYSDGAVALKVFEKYNIPYIVSVRGTDTSLYLKYRPDLFFLLKKIIQNASQIIFITEAIKNRFISNKYVQLTRINVHSKYEVICNGIDDFWMSKISPQQPLKKPNKILYIGRFDRNKNTINLIKAVLKLKKEYPNLKIDLVGKGGKNYNNVLELSKLHSDFIKYYGPVYDKNELRQIYLANDIFAMPSLSETFGLVYLEALSQGLPVLCSQNQGIDGTFN